MVHTSAVVGDEAAEHSVAGIEAGVGSRERLLAAAVDYVAEAGLAGLSLRRIGEAIGSSHRMLLYHFGSRDGLLVAIVAEVEQRQRDALAQDLDAASGDAAAATRRMWARLSSPDLAPNERLFFELYGRALGGDPGAAPILVGVVDGWIDAIQAQPRAAGMSRAEIRLGLAVIRGLLLDLLATGDRDGVTAALEAFLLCWT
jgi:AcrR family transcriptional regulator